MHGERLQPRLQLSTPAYPTAAHLIPSTPRVFYALSPRTFLENTFLDLNTLPPPLP